MARERVNKFSAESFTNSIGQTLQPGDKVVAVTTGYGHSVSVFEGVFEGVYRGPSYYGSDKQQISGTRIGQIPVTYDEQEFADDGAHEEKIYKGYDQKTRTSVYEKTGRRYNLIEKVKYRKSSLQRNRVFKIDTTLTKVTI
jgi:hypothetical protein